MHCRENKLDIKAPIVWLQFENKQEEKIKLRKLLKFSLYKTCIGNENLREVLNSTSSFLLPSLQRKELTQKLNLFNVAIYSLRTRHAIH